MKRDRRDPPPPHIDDDYAWCVENGYLDDAPEARGRMLAGYEAMKDVLQQRTWRRLGPPSRRLAPASRTPDVAPTAEDRELAARDDERASA